MESILKNFKAIIRLLFFYLALYIISKILSSIFNIHVAYFYFVLLFLDYFFCRNKKMFFLKNQRRKNERA